jgi:hypothetical protein
MKNKISALKAAQNSAPFIVRLREATRELLKILSDTETSLTMAAMFDAGEFSGPVVWKEAQRDALKVANKYGWGSTSVLISCIQDTAARKGKPEWVSEQGLDQLLPD